MLDILDERLNNGTADVTDALVYPAVLFLTKFADADLHSPVIKKLSSLTIAMVPSILASLDMLPEDKDEIEEKVGYIVAAIVGLFATVAESDDEEFAAIGDSIEKAAGVLIRAMANGEPGIVLGRKKNKIANLPEGNPIIDAWLARYSSDTKH